MLFAAPAPAAPAAGEDRARKLAGELAQIELDPDACYRIRDLRLRKDDMTIYLTDGYVTFSKPVSGRRVIAVFHTQERGDDGEVLVRPPDRGERASLASYTRSPTLSEHFKEAIFITTDGTDDELMSTIRESPSTKPSPGMGVIIAGRMNTLIRNIGAGFHVRLIRDLIEGDVSKGMLFCGFSGLTLGNFDALYDPNAREQIVLGQVTTSDRGDGFNVWASFETRAGRTRKEEERSAGRLENYRIDSVVHPDLQLESTTRVEFTPRTEVRGALEFEIASAVRIHSAKIGGREVEVFRRQSLQTNLSNERGNEPFLLILPEPLAAGRKVDLEFHHTGRVIIPSGNNVYFVASRLNWYPGQNMGHATFDLTFRLPKTLTLVSAGELVEDREEGENRIVRWRTPAPVRMAGFNIGQYDQVAVSRSGLTVSVYANRAPEAALLRRPTQIIILPPAWPTRGMRRSGEIITFTPPAPDPQARMKALADEISASLEFFAMHFGPPPLNTLTVSPIPGNFGQGFPGLLYLSTLSFLSESDRPASVSSESLRLFYTELLHSHEAAHQWWGNLVSAATYHDEWIQEALANYSALLVLERKKGPRLVEQVLDESINNLRASYVNRPIESMGPITWGVRLRSPSGVDPWRVITYDKGTWIIHMLRRRMGDERFMAMLGEIRKRFEYKTLSTSQFRELAAEHQPKGTPDPSLELFFDSWAYGTGIPTLELKTSVTGRAPKVQLTVSVIQTGVDESFSIDLPVEITVPGSRTPITRWVRTSSDDAGFRIDLRAAPSKVELAPGYGVLAIRK